MRPASRSVFTAAEKSPLDSDPGRRAMLAGIASLTPLVAIADQAKAANQKVSPEVEAELRALSGKVGTANTPKLKTFLSDAPPAPAPKPMRGLTKPVETPAAPESSSSAAAPSSPSLPSLPSLPKGFKFKLPPPF